MRSYSEFMAWHSRRKAGVQLYRDQMHEYQLTAYDFIRRNSFCALFIDLGMGKTVTSGTLAVDLLATGEAKRVLIIAPLRVANKTWPDELDIWDHFAYWDYSVVTGEKAKRESAARSRARIHITNRENIEWLVNFWGRDWPYDTVIIDESSAFKDHKTVRFKKLRSVRPRIKRMVQLTATPAAESYIHLFAQIYLLDEGKRLGKSITAYKRKYFDENIYTREIKLKEGAKEQIEAAISDLVLVMRAEDYLDLEKPRMLRNFVTLPDALYEQYKTLERNSIITVNGVDIVADNAAALAGKLLQFSSGVLYEAREKIVGEEVKLERVVHPMHELKMEQLTQIAEEAQGEPLLVVYHFNTSRDRLLKQFPQAKAMDKAGNLIAAWNKGQLPMLLVHPQSAGHGLNLQRGGRRIVFFDLPWSLELYQQVIGRLARQGQTKTVFVHHIIVKNSIDEDVYRALQVKASVQDALFEALKVIQAKRDTKFADLDARAFARQVEAWGYHEEEEAA